MVSYPCSKCGHFSPFTAHYEQEVQSEPISGMTHVLIPTTFTRCGHEGVFRWTRKEFIGLCKLLGIKPKIKEA